MPARVTCLINHSAWRELTMNMWPHSTPCTLDTLIEYLLWRLAGRQKRLPLNHPSAEPYRLLSTGIPLPFVVGMASTVSGIAPPHAAFRLVTCRLNTSIASIKARHIPLKEPHTFLFSFFPLLSALPSALPSYQDATLSDDYPLFQYGTGVTDGQP